MQNEHNSLAYQKERRDASQRIQRNLEGRCGRVGWSVGAHWLWILQMMQVIEIEPNDLGP